MLHTCNMFPDLGLISKQGHLDMRINSWWIAVQGQALRAFVLHYITISSSGKDIRYSCASVNHGGVSLVCSSRFWRRWHVTMSHWCRCAAGWVWAAKWSPRSCRYTSKPCAARGWSTSTGASPTTERWGPECAADSPLQSVCIKLFFLSASLFYVTAGY